MNKMPVKTIEQRWESFEKNVINPNAPEIQRVEMRNAFYAGAESMLQGVMVASEASVSDEEGVDILESYHQQMRDFAQELRNRLN